MPERPKLSKDSEAERRKRIVFAYIAVAIILLVVILVFVSCSGINRRKPRVYDANCFCVLSLGKYASTPH